MSMFHVCPCSMFHVPCTTIRTAVPPGQHERSRCPCARLCLVRVRVRVRDRVRIRVKVRVRVRVSDCAEKRIVRSKEAASVVTPGWS
jgi:hypothetical protein